jgi:hypothetical protein
VAGTGARRGSGRCLWSQHTPRVHSRTARTPGHSLPLCACFFLFLPSLFLATLMSVRNSRSEPCLSVAVSWAGRCCQLGGGASVACSPPLPVTSYPRRFPSCAHSQAHPDIAVRATSAQPSRQSPPDINSRAGAALHRLAPARRPCGRPVPRPPEPASTPPAAPAWRPCLPPRLPPPGAR